MKNSSYCFEVYDSIRRVNLEEWNSLRERDDLFMDPRFIEAVENAMGRECRFRHVVVRNAQGRPMATACLSSFVIGGASLAQGMAGKILVILERIAPWAIRSKLISWSCGFSVG